MAPKPQEHGEAKIQIPGSVLDGDEIVISGMAGIFPSSHHVKDLSEILYNKVNPIISEKLRWNCDHPEVAKHCGIVPDIDRFDAQFFKVNHKQTNNMDPLSRKILEQAYQAIYDAGVNSDQLAGKKVGVFVGACFSEADKAVYFSGTAISGLGISGCCRSMFANRISYWLDAKGPSMTIDEACCSSTAALEQAYLAIKRGECEAAVVGGAYLCLHPQSTVHYGRIMKQCMDGKTKSFDENGDGSAKSEAINVLFLQKAKDAMRIYAEVVHIKTEYVGLVEENGTPKYGFLRDHDATIKFLDNFYKEAGVPPHVIEYVEAFGSAIPDVDRLELNTIDEVICKGKDDPLFVGSIMSNVGYSDASTGITAIAKVLLGYHTGELAANLHYSKPLSGVPALTEGRMRILSEHQRFNRTYTAVNGMAISGNNAHVLLHGHYKPKDLSRYTSSIPHLVTMSARQDTTVKKFIEDLKSRPIDPEELALIHNIHQHKTSGHLGRGFVILNKNEEGKTVSISEKAQYYDDMMRPLWFVYSGMGSQWSGMGTQLMKIPIFAAAIERCRIALEPKGIDIVHIITSTDPTIFNNILHSFVGIAAVQIGLTDVLKALGLEPEGIIGHSVGELGCAYADGCLTAEEMILSAYSRGLVSLQTPFIRGSMAAVGLGYEKVVKICPPEIEVACHNGPESSTISGPAGIMREFVAELTAKKIFAKEVPCSNIAYHSRYIADAGPGLLKYLSEVITTPRERSERWVSTSVPKDKWDSPVAKYSSAEYHTNNLLNPVLFEEMLPNIPSNAVLVEVAPHGLLQAILKRSLPETCTNLALTRRSHPDNTHLVLEAVGKLYVEGFIPKIKALYPKVEMPVSTGTPLLSHHVEWAHGEQWNYPLYQSPSCYKANSCNSYISIHEKENKYLRTHIINGKLVYPHAGILVNIWEVIAMTHKVPMKEFSVEFKDVHLFSQPLLHEQNVLNLHISLQRGNGYFETMNGDVKVATGTIVAQKLSNFENEENFDVPQDMQLFATDIYAILKSRGYSYSGDFQSIESATASLSSAELIWRDNWVTFIDGILQLHTLRQPYTAVSLPTYINRISIDVEKHYSQIESLKSESDKVLLKAKITDAYEFTRCGGVTMESIAYQNVPTPVESKFTLNTLKFVPSFMNTDDLDTATRLMVYLQIIAENLSKTSIKAVAFTNDDNDDNSVFNAMKRIGPETCGVEIQYQQVKAETNYRERDYLLKDVDVIIVCNLSSDENICQLLHNLLRPNTFVVSEEHVLEKRTRPSTLYRVVSSHGNQKKIDLVRWKPNNFPTATTAITMDRSTKLSLIASTRNNLVPRHRLLIVSPYPAPVGLKYLVSSWRKEANRNMVNLIMVNNGESRHYLLDDLPDIDLAFNVVDHGNWGGEYLLPLEDVKEKCNNVILQSRQIGDLDALHWVEAPEINDGIPVNVYYAGINGRDLETATGTLTNEETDEISYGTEFSGVMDRSGERVMGIVRSGAVSSRVRAIPELLWPVPEHWSLEDAATVPFAYALVFYCLVIRTTISRNFNIFVHEGTDAIGQAFISVALALGCEVFTTVGDSRKKRFLRKLFPELKESHIGYSDDISFSDFMILETKNACCDIVIGSAKTNTKSSLYKCCASFSIVLELAKVSTQESYGMYHLTKAKSFAVVDIYTFLTNKNNADEIKKLQTFMSEGIARGYVRPLSRVTYAAYEAPRAFRLLSANQQRGRVLLRLNDSLTTAEPRFITNNKGSHLVLLNEETFGLQLVDRLVERGVRKLLIHNFNSNVTNILLYKLQFWNKMGVEALLTSGNLSTVQDVTEVLHKAAKTGFVHGVYTVTSDHNQQELISHLDSAVRKMCPKLRYFAVFNVGDSRVGEETCLTRTRQQLPAVVLNIPHQDNGTVYRSAVDAAELALRKGRGILVAQPLPVQQPSVLERIASITGTDITENVSTSTKVGELEIKPLQLSMIASLLRSQNNILLNNEDISSLTIDSLIKLERPSTVFKEVKGLQAFFSYISPDELEATSPLLVKPTWSNSATLRDDQFDPSRTYLCIVPGLDGHHHRFHSICQGLKIPALVLQPGLDRPNESMRETAERYVKILDHRTGLKNNFYLLGYETGVLIALEMAKILETHSTDITENVSTSTKVGELEIKPLQLSMIASLLRSQNNILLNNEDISSLTIDSLIKLERPSTVFKEVKGLQAFFSYISPDELEATSPLLVKPTWSNSATLRDDQFDPSRTYLCIVPGLDGHHHRFHSICQGLKIPALVLQPGLDRPNESMRETAERYVKILDHRTGLKNNFYLLGYETGVLIALEMAKILETHSTDITENVSTSTKVGELEIKPLQLSMIASLLRSQNNILLNNEDISSLTIDSLIKLERPSTVFKEVKGLQAFFSYISPDELEATSPLLVKPTWSNSATLRDDQFDPSRTYLCIVPGLDGHHHRFHSICQGLKIPALVLQPGLDRPNESMRETAERYVKILDHRTGLKNNFYLLGYETGVLIALEMAKILETHNLTGTVYCLGCAPDEMIPLIEEHISDFKTEEELDNAVIEHVFKLVVGSSDVKLKEALKEATTWNEKVDACVWLLRGRVTYSIQYIRAYLEHAHSGIRTARQYVSEPYALRSRLILLRAAMPLTAPNSLHLYSQQPVALHQLDVPLGLLASDNRCAAIINQYLDSKIIGDFEKMNLCEDYLTDPNIFMTPVKAM